MNEFLGWVKRIIATIAKIFIAFFSAIVDATSHQSCDEPGPKGHRVKSVVISVNDEGLIFLKSINGHVLDKYRSINPSIDTHSQNNTAPAGADPQPIVAMNMLKSSSGCFLVENHGGEIFCIPTPCPT